jgi:hypothetical protein
MFLSVESRQFESFAIGDSGIAHGDNLYDFSEIKSIQFRRIHTTQYVYWSKAGECEMVQLKIFLLNGSSINLSFNESYFFLGLNSNKKTWIERLIKTYGDLSSKTFQLRLTKFENQLDKFGFFIYDGARFVPSESLIVCKGKRFLVQEDRCLKSYGEIEFIKNENNFMNRFKRKLIEETVPSFLPKISTLDDTDVLFHLLDKHFGMKWSDT